MTWITGDEILERPYWGLGYSLIEAYERGLSPYRDFDGARMTTGSKCFNCAKASPGYKPGFVDEQGVCIPIKLRDAPDISPFPPFGLRGLEVRYPPLDLAMKIDPALVEHFFKDGEFVFHCGVFNKGIRPQVARLMTGVLGSSNFERLMLEGICSDFDPMGKLDMDDRLKAAKFKLKEVEEYEHRYRIGQVGAVPEVENVREQHTVIALLDNSEELPDSPVEYAQQLKSMGLNYAEVKYRIYHNGKKSWKLTWWKVHCIVEGLPEPTRGKKGADEKIKFKDDCLRQIKAWREGS